MEMHDYFSRNRSNEGRVSGREMLTRRGAVCYTDKNAENAVNSPFATNG